VSAVATTAALALCTHVHAHNHSSCSRGLAVRLTLCTVANTHTQYLYALRLAGFLAVYTRLIAVQQDQLQGDTAVLKNLSIGGIGLGWTELLVDAALYCALLKLPLWLAVLPPIGLALRPDRIAAFRRELSASDAPPALALLGKALYAVTGRTPGQLDDLSDDGDESDVQAVEQEQAGSESEIDKSFERAGKAVAVALGLTE
jgi:hypothetical protein